MTAAPTLLPDGFPHADRRDVHLGGDRPARRPWSRATTTATSAPRTTPTSRCSRPTATRSRRARRRRTTRRSTSPAANSTGQVKLVQECADRHDGHDHLPSDVARLPRRAAGSPSPRCVLAAAVAGLRCAFRPSAAVAERGAAPADHLHPGPGPADRRVGAVVGEQRIPLGPSTAERVLVTIDPRGRPVAVAVVQRLTLTRAGRLPSSSRRRHRRQGGVDPGHGMTDHSVITHQYRRPRSPTAAAERNVTRHEFGQRPKRQPRAKGHAVQSAACR